jgi:hypothetical protein
VPVSDVSAKKASLKISSRHRCEGVNSHGRSASRFHRCRRFDTSLVRIRQLCFWLCPQHSWSLLGALESVREREIRARFYHLMERQ